MPIDEAVIPPVERAMAEGLGERDYIALVYAKDSAAQ